MPKLIKRFDDYQAAASWLEKHGYTESVIEITDSVRVTLEGAHAVRAIEAATPNQGRHPRGCVP